MEKTIIKRKGKVVDSSFRSVGESFSLEDGKRKSKMSEEEETDPYGLVFWLSVSLSQIVAVAIIILAIIWGNNYGGFVFSDAELMFNYHPLFMIVGLIFFYGEAIITYRALRFVPKFALKVIHAIFHALAIIFSSIALVAVFENHRKLERADLYSLHSWMGIAAFALFCLQYVGSFAAFLFPGLPVNWRAKIMPYHRYLGVGIFMMVFATAEMGITEKLLWTEDYTTNQKITQGLIGNSLGILIMIFAFLILYISTHPSYKRKPLPSEIPTVPVS